MVFRVLGCILLLSFASTAQSLFDAIRNNDLTAIQVAKPETVNTPGRMGLTPLMHAAAFGSVDAQSLKESRDDMGGGGIAPLAGFHHVGPLGVDVQ